ncbi:MAG: hypothetical protein JO126_06570 [Alphaproteobacteria bacterium]|nr:hypothetical protein [Alphaproteobacteria bacterium]
MTFRQTPSSLHTVLQCFFCVLAIAGFAGCSSDNMPHVFRDNDVPDAVLQQPRLVAAPTQEELDTKTWLRLGDVPSKPTDFTAAADIEKHKQDMEALRQEGQTIRAAHPEIYDLQDDAPTAAKKGQ